MSATSRSDIARYDIARYDIAIIGGGLMGAALALLFCKTLPGRRVVLIEQKALESASDQALATPNFDARTTALAPTSAATLRRLGVWPALAAHVTAIRRVQVSDRGHLGWVRLDTDSNAGEPLGYVVENRALGRALTDAMLACEGLELKAPAQVQRLVKRQGGVRLELGDQSLEAELAVVADGADSPLRRQLGIGEFSKDYQQSAIIANVRHEQSHGETAFERFTHHGPLAFLPLGGPDGRTSAVVWTWPSLQAEDALALDDQTFLHHLQSEFGYRLGRLQQVGVRQSYPLRLCLAREQVRSGVVLMGNAAHFLHPVAGQGYNLALRDGLRLAEVLQSAGAGGLGDLALLQEYERRQAGDQRNTVRLSDGFNELFRAHEPHWILLRNLGMIGVEWSVTIRDAFIRQLSGRGSRRANPWVRLAQDS
ncbi:MAG: 2-octaprenyl-6-methoxyphenyl hydroxylase [Cellvibrionaceae bacterium]|nr:2-octaprenyl-6-methoxyphenyl hydroxylase [Cellvibrionaceae bacterium]